jgi:hypothetical protein
MVPTQATVQVWQDVLHLADAIKEGSAIAVSDGSYNDSFGTATWTIGTMEHPDRITGQEICPGAADDHSSYRRKLAGLYARMAVVQLLCNYFKVQEGRLEIGSDGQLLHSAYERGTTLVTDVRDYDRVAAILSLPKASIVE